MFEVIGQVQRERWDEIIASFDGDVYYSWDYLAALCQHGDGEPLLFYMEQESCRICYVALKSDISGVQYFENKLEPNRFYDLITPYGYGGPIVEGNFEKCHQQCFFKSLYAYCQDNNIVCQYIRYHPLYDNHIYFDGISENRKVNETICMDTSSVAVIQKNLTSRNRNKLRKAQKNHITIQMDQGEKFKSFEAIYNQTMDRKKADSYYYFDQSYYGIINHEMKENLLYFYACYQDQIIAAALFLHNDEFMHYHLSGTLDGYRNLGAMNLILYEAALWAQQQDIKKLHLGGGLSMHDSLFEFKKQFNRCGSLDFYIGRNIFCKNIYDNLLKLRKKLEPEFDMNNPYIIQYRNAVAD
ncbi:peptidoglycan bridge formation glycyltransferase FemA/FemB family protein [Eubacteriaceae bacterium ES2]|nr:peptidoglycan bridge formation glycyltransferase FemA/FemB family protein [Eubacteriaceae bacterium ES2]